METEAPAAAKSLTFPVVIFCYQFMTVVVNVTLAFYVQAMLPGALGLQWTGWMLGVVPLLAILTTPVWMHWASGPNPRRLYLLSQIFQGVTYLGMAIARTLPELFACRVGLGLSGPAQSIVQVMVGRTGGPNVRWIVSGIQTATTLGTALAPVGAAFLAARFGFTLAFAVGAVVMWACGAALLGRVAATLPLAPSKAKASAAARWSEAGLACGLTLIGYTHVYFLTAILPKVVAALGVEAARGLQVGGWILLCSGLAAAGGSMVAVPLAERLGERGALVGCILAGSACLVALGWATEPYLFTGLRIVEMLAIAPIMVLATARITQTQNSQAIGFVNSSRVLAAFVGPVLSTSLLARFSLPTLFVVLAAGGCLILGLVRRVDA